MNRQLVALAASLLAVFSCSRSRSGTSETRGETASVVVATVDAAPPPFVGKKIRDGRGVIRGFGENRKSVKIAHDDIADFAKATTTTFGVVAPYVLEGLKEGDAVDFTFSEEFDKSLGDILVQKINKR